MGPRQEGTGLRLCNRPVAADCGRRRPGTAGEWLAADGTGFRVPAEPGAAGAVRPGLRGGRGRFRPRGGPAGAAQKPLCDRRLRPQPCSLARLVPTRRALRHPEAPLFRRKRAARRGSGDVARGGARAARVTAEPDTGRARRRWGRRETRAGVG